MNKRGVSNVVATVLLILIVVVAIMILAVYIVPFVSEKMSGRGDCLNALQNIKFSDNTPYNCNLEDDDGDLSIFSIIIDSEDIEGFGLGLVSDGSSDIYEITDGTQYDKLANEGGRLGEPLEVVNNGEMRSYIFNGLVKRYDLYPILKGGKTCDNALKSKNPGECLDVDKGDVLDEDCGNGELDDGEECDRNKFKDYDTDATCDDYDSIYYRGDPLGCTNCHIDISDCNSYQCSDEIDNDGDNKIDYNDGIGDDGCLSDTDDDESLCGDGFLDSGEECDGSNFGGLTCEDYNGLGSTGTLICNSCAVDSSGCSDVGDCGDGTCDTDGGENCNNCYSDCSTELTCCGDGHVNGPEQCDGETGVACGVGGTKDCEDTCLWGGCGGFGSGSFGVCGDGTCNINEDCNSCPGDCGACAECELTNAYWADLNGNELTGGALTVVEGTVVYLRAETSGDCDGKEVEFEILEDDAWPLPDTFVSSPQNAGFSDGMFLGSWVSEYQDDIYGLPEYYFKVNLIGKSQTNSDTNKELKVSEIGGSCGNGFCDYPPENNFNCPEDCTDYCGPSNDGDSIGDACDNCPLVSNEDQANGDADSIGDACDNCPFTNNPYQENGDGDNHGDACDLCDGFNDETNNDGDGIPDGCDNCPFVDNANQGNDDGDPFGNACDGCEGYDETICDGGGGWPPEASYCKPSHCGGSCDPSNYDCWVADCDPDGDGNWDTCVDACGDGDLDPGEDCDCGMLLSTGSNSCTFDGDAASCSEGFLRDCVDCKWASGCYADS